jgi:hypothetical protein
MQKKEQKIFARTKCVPHLNLAAILTRIRQHRFLEAIFNLSAILKQSKI